jgi:hypothetical protein
LVFIQITVPKSLNKNIQLDWGTQQEVEKINLEGLEGLK